MKNLVLLLVLTLSAPVLTMAHSGDEQLYAAVQKRDKAKAEMLLKKKDDLNSIKQAGLYALVIMYRCRGSPRH